MISKLNRTPLVIRDRLLVLSILFLLLIWMFSPPVLAEEQSVDPLNMALFFAGTSDISSTDSDLTFDGTHVGLSNINFFMVTDSRMVLGYHYGEVEVSGVQHSINMPELSLNLDTNILALPMLRKTLPSHSIVMNAGGGFGISYLPYRYKTTRDSSGVEVEEEDWYWDHAAWNMHVMGGFALDEQLGLMVGFYLYTPFSGEPRFELKDLRIGLIYRL